MCKSHYCLIFILLFSLTSVYPQNLRNIDSFINQIDMKNIVQLIRLISSPKIKASVKVKALERISHVYKKHPNKNEKESTKLVKLLGKVIKKNKNDTQTNFYYKVRESACFTLGHFNQVKIALSAVAEIRNVILNDVNDKVQVACANVLGRFLLTADLASKVLLEKLNEIMETENKTNVSHSSTIKLTVIIRSLGKLASKASFIPLMQVLQSGLPIVIKKEAEEAIEKIGW